MFFFGSISTFLPYLIYISVVWICVLIGIRGQIFSTFLSSNKSKNQSVVESKEEITVENCFILNYHNTEHNTVSQKKSISQKNFFDFYWSETTALNYPILPDKVYQFIRISGNLLRAPPNYSV